MLDAHTAGTRDTIPAMRGFLARLRARDDGQDAVEYVLLLMLIALAVTAGILMFATGVETSYQQAASRVDPSTAPAGGGHAGPGGGTGTGGGVPIP